MTDKIKDTVLNFLDSNDRNMLVLRGDWGIGKTHFWKEWLNEYQRGVKSEERKYVYVSLFGVNSLKDFKNQITYGLYESVTKYLKAIKFPSIKGFSLDSDYIGWMAVKDILVCIDDFERHGKNLDPKDVFGIISDLKDQKACKIVLILNEKDLDENDKAAYDTYREKIVDIELQFSRDLPELINLVFSPKLEYFETVRDSLEKLNITNIRTLFKIRSFLNILKAEISDFPIELQQKIVRSVVLYTALYFSKPDPVKENNDAIEWPDLEHVMRTDLRTASMTKYNLSNFEKNVPQTDDEKRAFYKTRQLAILMDGYDWYGSDSLDQVIGDFIKRGYLDVEKFKEVYQAHKNDLDNQAAKDEIRNLHHKVGEVLWESYGDNVDEIYSVMEMSILSSLELGPSLEHLNQYLSILRGIGEHEKADALIDKYVQEAQTKNSNYLKIDDVNQHFSGPLDPALEKKADDAFKILKKTEMKDLLSKIDKSEVLRGVANRCPEYRLKEGDYRILSNFEYDDFYEFLKTAKIDRSVQSFLNIFLTNAIMQSCNEQHDKIKLVLSKVVQDISNESALNKWRMREFTRHIQASSN